MGVVRLSPIFHVMTYVFTHYVQTIADLDTAIAAWQHDDSPLKHRVPSSSKKGEKDKHKDKDHKEGGAILGIFKRCK